LIVAILSDIHGNLPALRAVLGDFGSVDALLCCGDVVGYYPDINDVCEILQNERAFVIRGNHDAYISGNLNPDPQKAQIYKSEWTRQKLYKENLGWLTALPLEMNFLWNGLKIKIRHASLWDEETYLAPNSPELSEYKLNRDEFYIFGHTHRPMILNVGEGVVLNPGSVGQPRDWDPRASYAILDTNSRRIEIRRIQYDVGTYQDRLRTLDWDKELINILSREKTNGL
jgi:putative phosphoesterase